MFFLKPDGNLTLLCRLLRAWPVGCVAGTPIRFGLEQFRPTPSAQFGSSFRSWQTRLALRLDVGLSAGVPLLDHRDLDNYLFPLAVGLTEHTGQQFVNVWGSKRHAETSSIGIEQANPRGADTHLDRLVQVRTDASSSTSAYKQQIHDQLEGVRCCPPAQSRWS